MSKLTGWWKNRNSAAKVELYTRWSFHFFVVIEAFAVLMGLAPQGNRTVTAALVLPLAAQVGLCGLLSSRSLDYALGRRERPARLAVALVALTAAICVAMMVLQSAGMITNDNVAPTIVINTMAFASGALTLMLDKVRHMLLLAPIGAVAVAALALVAGLPPLDSLGFSVGFLIVSLLLTFTCGFSRWLLKTVYELDHARELQAQLAVAEERLRFGRDLHDVMGRNLAVIALKSELAVQLARRERPEAVDQMIEVQRIARESQREVRDVVRGYREADLAVELEGARGVLSAAGMDCRVELEARGRTLPGEVQSALGWVVREATTNVLRHGDARSCLIRLTVPEGSGPVTLLVENDGAPDAPAGPPGSGLAGLRERLAAVGGTLLAGPAGGGLFRLRAEVPGPEMRRVEARA
ncbi:sensor histidine kinase [Streptomyces sp. NPDC090054]|uniref:sensor histidine kinase n=1 Tax=Streptomyces sp. NPDC090054 TaxID=3365933 RepID=UPI003810658C